MNAKNVSIPFSISVYKYCCSELYIKSFPFQKSLNKNAYVLKGMYDITIIGGGPSGFGAAIYASRYGLKTLLIGEMLGGQILESHIVENYPGIEKKSGMDFMTVMQNQAKEFGTEILSKKVNTIVKKKDYFLINDEIESKTVILALGLKKRRLIAKNIGKYNGLGVSYCATCDGAFFREKRVGVVGGADSAADAAILLAEIAKEVFIIYRKEKIRAENWMVKQIENNPKIKIINNTNVTEVYGEKMLKGVIFDNGNKFELDGLFIEIGFEPRTELIDQLGIESKEGLIIVNNQQETNVKGVWASGDCTTGSNQFNQIITASSEGVIAAQAIFKYLKQ